MIVATTMNIPCSCQICGPSNDLVLADAEDGLCESCRSRGHGRASFQFLYPWVPVANVPQLATP